MPADINHDCFKQPHKDSYVWRYYELGHFIELLKSKEINFARADCFDDPFEGTLGRKNNISENINNSFPGLKDEQIKIMVSCLGSTIEKIKYFMYLSCWHMNNYESIAMWRLYSKTKNSVAIKCKYSSLVNAFSDDVLIGKVDYIDYEKELIRVDNLCYPIMCKRKEYSYEKEIRAVKSLSYIDNNIKNLKEKVDLNSIIEDVYISPGCSSFFPEVVNDIINKYELKATIKKSNLYELQRYEFVKSQDT